MNLKKSSLVLLIIVFVISLCGLILWKALKETRTFVVLYNDKLNLCFLVDDHYRYELRPEQFKYKGGKNPGHIKLLKSGFSKDINQVVINGFFAGYQKLKNIRVYEYKLNDEYILRDEYQNIENMTVNLVPYREECNKIKENFKTHIKIFEGV